MKLGLDALTEVSPPGAELEQAQRFGNYFKSALWAGTPILAAPVDATAVPAMVAAMTFVNDGSAATVFAAGYSAFWATIVAAPTTYWPAMIVCVAPTGLAGLASAIAAQFPINRTPGTDNLTAAANLAGAIHPRAGLGGTGAIPPAAPTPIT